MSDAQLVIVSLSADSVSGSTEGLSPSGGSPRGGRTPPRGRSPPHDDTLFAEGLRIAHQYGMSDFAAHLKGSVSASRQGGGAICNDSRRLGNVYRELNGNGNLKVYYDLD